MKVGRKVGRNFGSVAVLVIYFVGLRMEHISAKLWATRSNRVRGTKFLVDKLHFQMEFVVFMNVFIENSLLKRRNCKKS